MSERKAKAVIGAGHGDEGKGLLTDILAAGNPGSIVVRSNGGAQAGHTVVTPDGRRHVFHHIGSGALAGAPTHLSAHFIAHPMMLLSEWETVRALGGNVAISSDPRAAITTPFDMMINQAVELARGTGRHGSCGLGFGETIERNLRPDFAISTGDLFRPGLRDRLSRIWTDWMPERLARLGLSALPESILAAIDVDAVIARFIADCDAYLDRVMLLPDSRIGEQGPVIFEAAQGLMLDQDHGAFPHVTRSHTGLRNMLGIAAEAGIDAIDVIYATRCYATRHGAGPLAHETSALEGITVDDPTNAPNDWQGSIRTAPLDLSVLRDAIGHDIGHARESVVRINASLAVTCLDQADGPFGVREGVQAHMLTRDRAPDDIAQRVGLDLFGASWGPSRECFRDATGYERAA